MQSGAHDRANELIPDGRTGAPANKALELTAVAFWNVGVFHAARPIAVRASVVGGSSALTFAGFYLDASDMSCYLHRCGCHYGIRLRMLSDHLTQLLEVTLTYVERDDPAWYPTPHMRKAIYDALLPHGTARAWQGILAARHVLPIVVQQAFPDDDL